MRVLAQRLPMSAPVRAQAAARAPALREILSPVELERAWQHIAYRLGIPHHFVDEGCHHRAHVAAHWLDSQGLGSEKIFALPGRGDLEMSSRHSPIGYTRAIFHVAVCVRVKTARGIERRVLDPSLGSAPMTPEAWLQTMRAEGGVRLAYAPRFVAHLSDREAPPASFVQRDLDDAYAWNRSYKLAQDDMVRSGFYEHLKELGRVAA